MSDVAKKCWAQDDLHRLERSTHSTAFTVHIMSQHAKAASRTCGLRHAHTRQELQPHEDLTSDPIALSFAGVWCPAA